MDDAPGQCRERDQSERIFSNGYLYYFLFKCIRKKDRVYFNDLPQQSENELFVAFIDVRRLNAAHLAADRLGTANSQLEVVQMRRPRLFVVLLGTGKRSLVDSAWNRQID